MKEQNKKLTKKKNLSQETSTTVFMPKFAMFKGLQNDGETNNKRATISMPKKLFKICNKNTHSNEK